MENNLYSETNVFEEGDRGLGKKILVGAGIAAVAVGTAVVVGGVVHHTNKKRKKKKVKVYGKTREIDCDVLVDERGFELPGQEFNEHGYCINEQEVLSRAYGTVNQQHNNYQQANYPEHKQENGYQNYIQSHHPENINVYNCDQQGQHQNYSYGYQPNNYPQNSYPQNNYPQSFHPQNNYPQNNYPQNNYPQSNYPQNSYPQNDYPQNAYVHNHDLRATNQNYAYTSQQSYTNYQNLPNQPYNFG